MRESGVQKRNRKILAKKINAIMILETQKPYAEMDCDLVYECLDFLMELQGKKRIAKERIQDFIDEIPFEGKPENISGKKHKKNKPKKNSKILPFILLFMLIFSLMLISSKIVRGTIRDEIVELYNDRIKIHFEDSHDPDVEIAMAENNVSALLEQKGFSRVLVPYVFGNVEYTIDSLQFQKTETINNVLIRISKNKAKHIDITINEYSDKMLLPTMNLNDTTGYTTVIIDRGVKVYVTRSEGKNIAVFQESNHQYLIFSDLENEEFLSFINTFR